MATFFVGQRVKVVRVLYLENSYLIGLEGRIVQVVDSWNEFGSGYGLDVKPIWHDPQKGYFAFSAIHLEPILPEGMQPASWSDCAWQPEHLRQKA